MRGTQRTLKLLLLLHLIGYTAYFMYAIDGFKFDAVGYVHDYFIILLFWLPILLLHVGVTYHQLGHGDISRLERDAYREGFADAARQFADRSYDAPQLALDDEGEFVELPEKRKRVR